MVVLPVPKVTSPFNLCQEIVRDSPWQVLVVCMMLNQTTGVQVRRVFPDFFRRWPDANSFLRAAEGDVKAVLRPLGFYNRRYERIRRMSEGFLQGFQDVRELHGIGKYAADSYELFVSGLLVLDVQDKELKKYVQWAREAAEADHAGPGRVQPGGEARA